MSRLIHMRAILHQGGLRQFDHQERPYAMSDLEQPEKKGISRRTVTKAMAWSVPAIAIAAPVPAMAASGSGPVLVPGPACKIPGNTNPNKCPGFEDKSYLFPFVVQNFSNKPIYICDVTISTTPNVGVGFAVSQPALPAMVPAASNGVPGEIVITFGTNSTDSANQVFTADISVSWGHEADCTDTDHDPVFTQVQVGATPPNCPCFN